MPLPSGLRLGSYEVESPIGSGAMGAVYRARDLKLGRDVALKVLADDVADDAERRARFEQEARSASALNHPSIIHIYDIGEQDGRLFIAMELVEGTTLRRHLAAGALATDELLRFGRQIADGLAKAHATGIVHRDLKPENVMVSADGYIKLVDFGLAKLIPPPFEGCEDLETVANLSTRPGTLMGTVEYMSPEQARAARLDFRTDQFSFGAMLYEMATGRIAFQRETPVQTLAAIIEREPEPALGEACPHLSAEFVAIVERCLAKAPSERFASTAELARALVAAVSTAPSPGPPPSPPSPPRQAELVIDIGATPATGASFYVQTGKRKTRRVDEPGLRARLRRGRYSGLELVRRDGDDRWQPLCETEMFRQEVPYEGDPADVARRRHVKGFGWHLFGFVMAVMFGAGATSPVLGGRLFFLTNSWVFIWGLFLLLHGIRVLPSALALIGIGRGRPSPPLPAVAAPPAAPALPAPRDSLPAGVRDEVEQVRSLLDRRGGADRERHLGEVDRLVEVMRSLATKRADLAAQTGAGERQRLEETARETEVRIDASDLEQDQNLFQRRLEVVRSRQRTIEKARRALERIDVRLDVAEHQIKQLRLDLTRAEATISEAPELSSRLLNIRHEVDAIEEVDELFADL